MVNNIGSGQNDTENGEGKMSSSELQKIFYTTYKEFFNVHDIVLDGNAVLTWGADISQGVSALRIKQKLPVKTYCGVKCNSSGRVTFGNMVTYSIRENVFNKNDLHTIFMQDVEHVTSFLQSFLLKNNYTGGIDIDFLFEAPPGHGFAFSGVISVLLTFLVYTLTGKLNTDELVNREFPLSKKLFNEMYAMSLKITHCIVGDKSVGGSSNYTVMMSNYALPVVHLSQKCIHEGSYESIIDDDGDIHRCVNTMIHCDSLLNFLGKNDPGITELPVDYGVVFTGLEYRFADIQATREQKNTEEKRIDTVIQNIIASLSIPEHKKDIAAELLNFDKNEGIYKNIGHMNLEILEGFDSLLENIQTDSSVDVFIDTIRKIGLESFSYQKENKLYCAIQYLFHQYKQFDDETIGILPFNTGRIGGSLFFVMKKGKSRATIQKVLAKLKQDGYSVSLDHASWRDGISGDGVRLEQYLSAKIYSEYTRAGDVSFVDSHGYSYCGEYDAIIKNETNAILLDTIGGRIYIQGNKLTSKDIHSQNTTIDMLKILIENIGQEVSNSRLPVSTYSQNKNELLTKVVLPIKKLAKEYFGQEISLTCSGGITEYYLRLERDEAIRIGMIQVLQ